MKKLFLSLVVLFTCNALFAQYNNSWIDYNKTYYKFKLAQDRLYRIPQSVLASAGLAATNADHFQLWHNGQQVRMYTPVSGTALGSSDYLEFWGEMNTGKQDSTLYRVASYQISDRYSLETDTSAYFLTVNPAGGNLRFTSGTNAAPIVGTPDPYFMRTVEKNWRDRLNPGYAVDAGAYLYSSSYDIGEGWSSGEIYAPGLTHTFSNMNVYTAGPANSVEYKFKAAGSSFFNRFLKVSVNGQQIDYGDMSWFALTNKTISGQPVSNLTENTSVAFQNISSNGADRFVIGQLSIKYPATFNFNAAKNFDFELQPSPSGNNLEISNFDFGTTAPILYDLTSGARYLGNITAVAGKVQFVLPPSASTRKMILISNDASNLFSISTLTARNFINYSLPTNQGNYAIITNKALFNDGNGVNQVEQYRQYRTSANGGGYNAKIYDIDELTDQFAFGIKFHPEAIRNYLFYAMNTLTTKPEHVFLIGRGANYNAIRVYESQPDLYKITMLPTFGWPASDNLFASTPGNAEIKAAIGRLSVVNGAEIKVYLDKVRQFDIAQKTFLPTINTQLWLKDVMHVTGGSDYFEQQLLESFLRSSEPIIKDTLFGAWVESFSKNVAATVQTTFAQRITDKMNNGTALISYLGHSSATTIEFNLSSPEIYSNTGKYPFFDAAGCSAGDCFNYTPNRLTQFETLSEKFVLTSQKGSIGFLASTNLGLPYTLDLYNKALYRNISSYLYGNTIGNQIKKTSLDLNGANPNQDFAARIHIEQILLHGDPAIRLNNFPKPDYAIEDQYLKVNPAIVSVADNSFTLGIKYFNLGKAINDSIVLNVRRRLPDNSMVTIFNQKIKAPLNRDSINITVPINVNTDKGLNRICISLDYTNKVDELFETNNEICRDIYILENDLRPVYPYNFSIQNVAPTVFSASSPGTLATRNYFMEIDTTELFNSPLKRSFSQSGLTGLVEFRPTGINYLDSTVYYWRVTDSVPGAALPAKWNSFSFIYLPSSSEGYNQSHYFQHKKSTAQSYLELADDRKWKFGKTIVPFSIKGGVFPTAVYMGSMAVVDVGGNTQIQSLCNIGKIIFNVFNPVDVIPKINTQPVGLYNSEAPCGSQRMWNFQYDLNNQASRIDAAKFMDSIADGMYVVVRISAGTAFSAQTYADTWMNDQSVIGQRGSLYYQLRNAGLAQIDSFNRPRVFHFMYKKGDPTFTPVWLFSQGIYDQINLMVSVPKTESSGTLESPVFGPARAWNTFRWGGASLETNSYDSVSFKVYGLTQQGSEVPLFNVDSTQKVFDISSVNANQYPYLKLKMLTTDTSKGTPYQLKYWRLNYQPVAEGALAPSIHFNMADTIEQGQPVQFSIAFKNVSRANFDSMMKFKLQITDGNNVVHNISVPKGKLLVSGDTLIFRYTIPTSLYPGINTLFLDVNPDGDQLEQYHFNNIFYKSFVVSGDKVNPLLDVTFDGVHILNRDIVSSKPNITIKLKDENKFLALSDTSLLKVQVVYPSGLVKQFYFNGDTMRFTPANLAQGINEATIELMPYFPQDGVYQLIVSGKDVSGNTAGSLEYKISFTVINKPMISNMLNYPNPFTSSTAFVFTLTGTKVPDNIRIQILTVSGKVVKEINKNELGPLHIGRNITQYKWDGTDAYGQALANGVYLYRVVTRLDGNALEKYTSANDNTDQYFNKGYGKMYLMR